MIERLHPTPIGPLRLLSDGEALTGLYFPDHRGAAPAAGPGNDAILKEAAGQIDAYFAGNLRTFDLPLRAQGTEFQQRVWRLLMSIPFGETASYLDLAKALGQPTATRAVGLANGQNSISLIVPCHRVVGTGGKLTGYAGGLDRKRRLLAFEASVRSGGPHPFSETPSDSLFDDLGDPSLTNSS